jgi:hypothetical protein
MMSSGKVGLEREQDTVLREGSVHRLVLPTHGDAIQLEMYIVKLVPGPAAEKIMEAQDNIVLSYAMNDSLKPAALRCAMVLNKDTIAWINSTVSRHVGY